MASETERGVHASTTHDKIEHLRDLREQARLGGGERRIEAQHAKGKLTARERLDLLLDQGTFVEIDRFVTHRSSSFGLDNEHYYGDGVVYSPAMTDFTFMVQGTSFMFVTGPDVVKTVTHEVVDFEGLGGASVHSSVSGVAHFAAEDEAACLDELRRLVGFLPSNNLDDAPGRVTSDPFDRMDDALNSIVPDQPTRSYDMHNVI